MQRAFKYLPDMFVTSLKRAMEKDKLFTIYVSNEENAVLFPENCTHVKRLCKKFKVKDYHDYALLLQFDEVSIYDMRLSPTALF